jgi:hypothetical protein
MKQQVREQTDRSDRSLSRIILSTSGAMVGVCATVIGLIKVVEGQIGSARADEYLGLVLVCFIISAFTSYLSIRHADRRRLSRRLEVIADIAFLLGLLAVASIGLFFAYELI